MGSGKSTIGPILANTIGYAFADIDRSIEAASGLSVPAIFKELGEERFRELEHSTLAALSEADAQVIALGGGTLAAKANLEIVLATGIMVYLKVSREQVFHRLRHRSDRPMLMTPEGIPLGDDALRAKIASLFEVREPIYALADIAIPTDESRLGVTVDHLVRLLSPLLR
jgi:shikimate kinase